MSLPESYNTLNLPALKLSHHPASSKTVTPIIIIQLNRPEAHHSWTDEMADSLVSAYGTLSVDPRVRAIVLTSADTSNRFFCAGMDLNAKHKQNDVTNTVYRDAGGRASLAMHQCSKPVIAAINGSAVGVGITMCLPATVRVANKDAKIGFVFGRRGFCMEACSSFYLPRLIGTSRAMHLVSTGAVLPASHKLLDGLFSEVVPGDQVLPTALKVAEDISANMSLTALGVMKDMLTYGPTSPEEAHLLESKMFSGLFEGPDVKEGMESFLQKRAPNFTANMEKNRPRGYPWYIPLDVKAKI